MNVLSLCDGMSCGQIALEQAGVKVDNYYAAEIKPVGIKVTKANYPNTIHIGDVTKVNYENGILHTEKGDYQTDIDMVIFGSPCFAKGTLVLTDKGYKNIEDVRVGNYVLAHDNKMHKVTNHMMTGIKKLYEVKVMGAETLKTTENHKFYVRKRIKTWNNKIRKYDTSYTKPEWVEAKDLNNDCFVGYAINQASDIPVWKGVECYRGRKLIRKRNINLRDKNLWYIAGRYVGDGWVTKRYDRNCSNKYNGAIICCGKHKLDKLRDTLAKLYHFNLIEERTVYKLKVYDIELGMFLSQFGQGAKNKRIPNFVLDLPVDLLSEFLKGYFDADGCSMDNGRVRQFTTISRELAYGIIQCIAKVTHKGCTLHKTNVSEKCIIEGREVNQNPFYTVKYRVNNKGATHSFYEDNHIWLPIRSVTETEIYEEVYDITVEEAHSFTANGCIVHNCQSFSVAMRSDLRIGLNDPKKSGLFYECYRIMKEVNPKYFFLENVARMKKTDEEVLTQTMGVKPVRLNSELVSPQLRDRLYWTNIPYNTTIPKNITLQSILENGYTDREKARALLVSDSRPLTTPVKMFHRYYSTGFTTLIFKSKEHYEECVAEYKRLQASKIDEDGNIIPLTAKDLDSYTGKVFDGVRYMTQDELEKCQCVPSGYTKCLTRNEAADVLGDGWTIGVITEFFKNLPKN